MSTIFRSYDVTVTIDNSSIVTPNELISYNLGDMITPLVSQQTYGEPVIIQQSQNTREVTIEVKGESNANNILNAIYNERVTNSINPHQIVIYDGAKGYVKIKEAFLSNCACTSSPTDGISYTYTFIHYENISFTRAP